MIRSRAARRSSRGRLPHAVRISPRNVSASMGRGRRLALGERSEAQLRRVAAVDEPRVQGLGVLRGEHAIDDLEPDLADTLVQLVNVGGEAGALDLDLVGLVGQGGRPAGHEVADVVGREHVVVDVAEHGVVELLQPDVQPGAMGLVLLTGGADVVVEDAPAGATSSRDLDAAATRAAPEPRGEHVALGPGPRHPPPAAPDGRARRGERVRMIPMSNPGLAHGGEWPQFARGSDPRRAG